MHVLLVNPRFKDSFWNYRTTCEIAGAKYPAAPLGLITVAAMLPKDWHFKLVDHNIAELSASDIDLADLIMITGMMPQHDDMMRIIELCHARGKRVAVGGPSASASPGLYVSADYRIVGEAETIISDFISALLAGEQSGLFQAQKFTADVTKTPIPRFDLLDFKNYLNLAVQFSRGCPFKCEFCDIIELYGRVPRTKTAPQMLAELDAIYATGYRGHVDFVDDNFIGNKKAVKLFLPHLIAWQKARNFPFEFSTEASVNMADDDDLLKMMRDANFFAVFVGIESPDPETLIATQKKQNVKGSLTERIRKIYNAGLFVNAGFIVGFDSEKGSVSTGMVSAIEAAAIPICMVGLLYALPGTQLTRRLEIEGRAFEGWGGTTSEDADQCTAGLNFLTKRPRQDILSDYIEVLEKIYDVDAYFERVRRVGRQLNRPAGAVRSQLWNMPLDLYRLARVIWLMPVRYPRWRRPFWSTFFDILRHNPSAMKSVISMMVMYAHLGPFSQFIVARLREQISDITSGAWVQPMTLSPHWPQSVIERGIEQKRPVGAG